MLAILVQLPVLIADLPAHLNSATLASSTAHATMDVLQNSK
jgi:hypothetical protein